MFDDNLDDTFEKFFASREEDLFHRFPDWLRGVVVDTNDPLQTYRVRFKAPELHDSDLKPENCPWAIPAPWLGGKNAGSWRSPCIGDIIWICFEKGHPYAPMWMGFASGTRRKRYPLESVYTPSPLALTEDEKADETPDDFISEYLPADDRPMSHGWRDRTGNFEINSSVGYFPVEHNVKPTLTGQDAISKKDFNTGKNPKVNDPDRKYLARCTKYGNYIIQSDVGYYWKIDGDVGEFNGDFDKDRSFEIERSKYLTRLFNEDEPQSAQRDQRRLEMRTRAGHLLELRDVGYAQNGGAMSGKDKLGPTKSRDGEYGDPRVLSKWDKSDERWLKLRTKGGHLIQAMDMGFHPEEDNFYSKLLIDEIGPDTDSENTDWIGRDARQIRIITRWGSKFVLDDRGTDSRAAELQETPRANGWLLKTHRSWTADPSIPLGFGFEANDKDELNTSRWYSPKSKIVEINDNKDYMLFCTDTANEISREWQGKKENEFATSIGMTENPENDTYHLKLDKHNGYIRLKTSGNKDGFRRMEGFDIDNPFINTPTVGLNQGLEARDSKLTNNPWVELNDLDDRGIWMSHNLGMSIWRAGKNKDQWMMIVDQDGNEKIVIHNAVDAPIQIYSMGATQILAAKDLQCEAGRDILLKAGRHIGLQARGKIYAMGASSIDLTGGGGQMKIDSSNIKHNKPFADGGADQIDLIPIVVINQDKRAPDDRALTNNQPFDAVSSNIIEGK